MKEVIIIAGENDLAHMPNAIKHYASLILEIKFNEGPYSNSKVKVIKDRLGDDVGRALNYSQLVGYLRKNLQEGVKSKNILGDF